MSPRASTPGRRVAAALVLAAALLPAACVDSFLAPEPGDDAVALFDLFWAEIDAYYAYFAYKPWLDWNAIREEYRAGVSAGMPPRDLAELMGTMIAELRDGHADLHTPFGPFGFDPFAGQPQNYLAGATRDYIVNRRVFAGGVFEAGLVAQGVGYVRVASLGVRGTGPVIDDVLAAFPAADAWIIDLRGNGGGSDTEGKAIAARFYDRPRVFRSFRYRDGPAHDDFGDLVQDEIEPAGDVRFAGPVAVLTNAQTFSAAEGLVAAFRALPHAVVVGDTTGGGAGNPIWRELPNGWTYRVPRWVVWTHDGLQYEGVGIPPHITLGDTDPDLVRGLDSILETAIFELWDRLAAADGP